MKADNQWCSTWFAAPYGPCPFGFVDEPVPLDRVFPGATATDQTIRLVVRATVGGRRARFRFSNLMGREPLKLAAGTAGVRALRGHGANAESPVELSFNGSAGVVVPAGGDVLSDAVTLDIEALDELVVAVHVAGRARAITWHAKALATSYASPPGSGDRTRGIDSRQWHPIRSWPWLTEVQVEASRECQAIVAIGDSITDGSKLPCGEYARWTDRLASALAEQSRPLAVLNAGIGSNRIRVIENGSALGVRVDEHATLPCRWCGPTVLERFDADVLQRPGVKYVVIAGGLNDLAAGLDPARLVESLAALAKRARTAGVGPIGWSITPVGEEEYGAKARDARLAVNKWLGSSDSPFDYLLDAATILADPTDPHRLDPQVDSGDGIHPNAEGHRRLALGVQTLLADGLDSPHQPEVS